MRTKVLLLADESTPKWAQTFTTLRASAYRKIYSGCIIIAARTLQTLIFSNAAIKGDRNESGNGALPYSKDPMDAIKGAAYSSCTPQSLIRVWSNVMKPHTNLFGSKFLTVLTLSVLFLISAAWAADEDKSDIEKRIDNAAKVLDEIMATPDKAIPDKVISEAKCIAVIPSMVKIAVGFGGNHGKGVTTCRTATGKWSGLAPITITGGSWGLQLGGQAVDLVMIVTNDEGMQHLLSSKFKIGADASAAAGPVGRDAGADTDWKMKAQLLTYSRARGLFAGIDLSGSVVTQDKDETRIMYGKFVPFGEILAGKVRRTAMSRPFLSTVSKYTGEKKSENRPPIDMPR
jgi:SH3 domain-containing YSC84-like protein 1